MRDHKVVGRSEWLEARRAHLENEKRFSELRDQLSAERRQLPWVQVDEEYRFHGLDGEVSLADLFHGKHQLIVYHFMFGPDWEEGCTSCSFWADNADGIDIHLAHRDISLVFVSRAPLAKLENYRQRMGWKFRWYSSHGSNFNFDYGVSFTPEEMGKGEVFYNFRMQNFPVEEAHGISVFYRDEDGAIYHTYSCYQRGLDMLNGAYHYMDLAPKGRDEDALEYSMDWLRRHDEYEN